MHFQFIDSSNIDASTRKQIRSSVMLGRNAGKTRPRKGPTNPKKPRTLIPDVAKLSRRGSDGSSEEAPESAVARMVMTVGNEFTPLKYPKPLEPYMQHLLYEFMQMTRKIIYPKEFCLNVDDFNVIWFEFFQKDEAFFHCLLAMAQAFSDWLRGVQGESPRVMRYLANTYRCINEKLKKEETPDDATLAVVMSMTMHNNLLRAPGGAKVHLDALQHMVQLRGGLDSFQMPVRFLCHKICRTDIEFSLQSGTTPRFYRDNFPYAILRSSAIWTDTSCEAFATAANADILTLEIQNIFRDTVCASTFINMMEATKQKFEPFSFQEILISLGYRLMHQYPLDEFRLLNPAEDACQLALLAMVTTMLIRHGHSKVSYKLLAAMLQSSISRLGDNATSDENFIFWVMFMGGVSVFEAKDDEWLFLRLRRSISKLGLGSWQAVKVVLDRYPWITYFHDEPGLELWNTLMEM